AFADLLPFAIELRFTVSAFAIPLVFAFLTSFAFALWPLGQAMGTSPLELFRTAIAPLSGKPSSRFIFGTVFFTTMLSALAITNTHDTRFAMWFIVSAIAC